MKSKDIKEAPRPPSGVTKSQLREAVKKVREKSTKDAMDKKELNGSEAVYGFAAWLTTRKEKITLSASHNAAEICDLVQRFCKANNLSEVSKNYPDNLNMDIK